MQAVIVLNIVLLVALGIVVWDFIRTRTQVMKQCNEFTKTFSGLIEENKSILNRAASYHERMVEEMTTRRQEFDREVRRVVDLVKRQ